MVVTQKVILKSQNCDILLKKVITSQNWKWALYLFKSRSFQKTITNILQASVESSFFQEFQDKRYAPEHNIT